MCECRTFDGNTDEWVAHHLPASCDSCSFKMTMYSSGIALGDDPESNGAVTGIRSVNELHPASSLLPSTLVSRRSAQEKQSHKENRPFKHLQRVTRCRLLLVLDQMAEKGTFT